MLQNTIVNILFFFFFSFVCYPGVIKLVWRSLFIVGVDLGGYMCNVVFVSFTFFTWSVLLYLSVLLMLYVTLHS